MKCAGEVSIHRELDREEDSEFEFTVASSDGGGRVGYCSVKVVVKDENDNEPSFSVQEYTANIRYDAPTGARIVQVFHYLICTFCISVQLLFCCAFFLSY